jgi:hypothetical protein
VSLISFHIPFERLVDLAEARLPVTEKAQLMVHVARCNHCQQTVARVERLLGLMRSDRSEDAPPALIARAIKLFPVQVASIQDHPVRRLLAMLRFDNWQQTPALGMRAEGASARQCLFTAGDYDIDIRIAPVGEAWRVAGQVLSDDAANGRVALHSASTVLQTQLNDQSEFTLSSVPAGFYTLLFHLPDVELEVDALQVGV